MENQIYFFLKRCLYQLNTRLLLLFSLILLFTGSGYSQMQVAVMGSNQNGNVVSYLNSHGFTATDFGYSVPSAATLANYNAVVLLRMDGNADLQQWVLNGGRLVTEWYAAEWATNTTGLLSATATVVWFVGTGTPITFNNNSLGNQLAIGLPNPYSDEGATEFFYNFTNLGGGVTIGATRPTNLPAIIAGASGSGSTVVIGYDWADYTSAPFGGNSGQLLINALNASIGGPVAPPNPTSITASSNPVCTGTGIQLTANGASGTVYWFTGSCATSGEFATGNPVNVNPTSTTTYYVRNYNGLWSSGCASLEVVVEQTPVAATLVKNPDVANVCEGTNVSATLSGGSGGNGNNDTQYQTHDGASWSGWTTYTPGNNISTSGKAAVEIRTRRLATYCSPSGYNTVSWTVERTPVAATLVKNPDLVNVCEGSDVSATLSGGAGGNGNNDTEYRTYDGAEWSDWSTYIPGNNILTSGTSAVEIHTRRLATYCGYSDYNTISWTVEQTPVTGTLAKYPDELVVCGGDDVSTILSPGDGGDGTDILEYRIQTDGTTWSDWDNYNSGDPIETLGKSAVEIHTWRNADYCDDSEPITIGWSIRPNAIIPLSEGWSAISAYFQPVDTDIENIMQPVVEELTVFLGTSGLYAPPPFNLNTLITWDVTEGYKLKMKNAGEIVVCGDSLENNVLTLGPGFHYIPVLTNVNSPIATIFQNPAADILYIFDLTSNYLYWPAGGIFSLTSLTPGRGYLAHFINAVTIDFPNYDPLAYYDFKSSSPVYADGPWPCEPNFNIHLVSIDSKAFTGLDANYIGAFNARGNCVGYAALEGTAGNVLLTIYGDDEYSGEKDGCTDGEKLTFRAYNSDNQEEETLIAVFDPEMPQYDGSYALYGQSRITAFIKASSVDNPPYDISDLVRVYPNPATDEVTIVYPWSGSDVDLILLSAEGKAIRTITLNSSETVLDVSTLKPGIYILKFKDAGMLTIKRLVIR